MREKEREEGRKREKRERVRQDWEIKREERWIEGVTETRWATK